MSTSWSKPQKIALAIAPKVTGSLSVIGSLWIIVEITTDASKRQNIYHRLLLAASVVDVLASSCLFASTWPIPQHTDNVLWAVGNENTCVVQGLFIQFGIATPVYSALLAIYYQLVVQYKVQDIILKRHVEPAMHVVALSIGIIPALAGLFLKLYNNADLWCWIAPLPLDCESNDDVECLRGQNSGLYRWVFYYIILWAMIIIASVSTACVYYTVWKREHEMFSEQNVIDSRSNADMNNNDNGNNNPNRIDMQASFFTPGSNRSTTSWENLRNSIIGRRKRHSSQSLSNNSQTITNKKKKESSSKEISSSLQLQQQQQQQQQQQSTITKSSDELKREEANAVAAEILSFGSARKQHLEATKEFGSRAILHQALWYTAAFYITYSFATINRAVQQATGQDFYVLLFLHVLFVPFQGALNFLVYRRNHYYRLRQQNPHLSTQQLLQRTWRFSFMGPPSSTNQSRIGGRVIMNNQLSSNILGDSKSSSSQAITNKAPNDVSSKSSTNRKSKRISKTSRDASTPKNNDPKSYIPPDDYEMASVSSSRPSSKMELEADDRFDGDMGCHIPHCNPSPSASGINNSGDIAEFDTSEAAMHLMDDLLVSFCDFPNMLTEEELPSVFSNFPTMTEFSSLRSPASFTIDNNENNCHSTGSAIKTPSVKHLEPESYAQQDNDEASSSSDHEED